MIVTVTIFEQNFDCVFDYTITSHGYGGTAPSMNYPGDPPEGAEYDLEVLGLYNEKKELVELPGWLKNLLEEHLYNRDDVNDKVQDADRGSDYLED